MFDALKGLIANLAGSEQVAFAPTDYRLAAAALMIHVGDVDGVADAREDARLEKLIAAAFGLSAQEARKLIAEAQQRETDSIDLSEFTHVLKRHLDVAGRRRIVEMMWGVALADGKVHEFEESLIWRVCGLLELDADDLAMARATAMAGGEKGALL